MNETKSCLESVTLSEDACQHSSAEVSKDGHAWNTGQRILCQQNDMSEGRIWNKNENSSGCIWYKIGTQHDIYLKDRNQLSEEFIWGGFWVGKSPTWYNGTGRVYDKYCSWPRLGNQDTLALLLGPFVSSVFICTQWFNQIQARSETISSLWMSFSSNRLAISER